jgi:hypothetical protein
VLARMGIMAMGIFVMIQTNAEIVLPTIAVPRAFATILPQASIVFASQDT